MTDYVTEFGSLGNFRKGRVIPITDEILVLRHGKMVELGPTAQIIHAPTQEYTRALVSVRQLEPFALPPARAPEAGWVAHHRHSRLTHTHEGGPGEQGGRSETGRAGCRRGDHWQTRTGLRHHRPHLQRIHRSTKPSFAQRRVRPAADTET